MCTIHTVCFFLGTTVVAANLFKNLPVRRQFYNTARKQKEELKRVEDLVVTYGIIYPRVRFELRHNKCVIWQKGAVIDHREALLAVWGAGALGHMTHVNRQLQGVCGALSLEHLGLS